MLLSNEMGRPLKQCCLAIVFFVSVGMVGLWVTPANSYVLTGPHILDLMVKKLSGVKRLQVDQTVTIEDPSIAGRPVELKETLRFIYPDRFRSDMRLENTHRFYVLSKGKSLTVVDGTITTDRGARFNRYKDLFLYNAALRLHKTLANYGVDVGVTSLGRMEDRIVFVIGANYPDDSVSQLWVDKERFVPLRWINIIPSKNSETATERLDFVYRNWQEVDGVWYPMKIDTFHNQAPIRQIRVTKVQADGDIPGDLFDIQHFETKYKKQAPAPPDTGRPASNMDDVQRTLEDFRKKFDP